MIVITNYSNYLKMCKQEGGRTKLMSMQTKLVSIQMVQYQNYTRGGEVLHGRALRVVGSSNFFLLENNYGLKLYMS